MSTIANHACIVSLHKIRMQKHCQSVMLVEWQAKSAKTTHTSVWIAQDTTESKVPRLNVHSNQTLARKGVMTNCVC